ncbi:MAG: hypothetical protein ACE5F1_00390 [Planctomycetota bacterium]
MKLNKSSFLQGSPAGCIALAAFLPAALPAQTSKPDPSKAEVRLPAAGDWRAFLLLDNGSTGIWTVESFPVFPQYAVPEVVGLDDSGRCHVLVSYSGKWTPRQIIHDGKWLGGLAHADVDPRVAGSELYTGGKLGNLYQIVAHPQGALDCRLIAYLPGREIHTIVAGDLDPRSEGSELLVFTSPGGLYRASPSGPHGGFVLEHLQNLPGRVRDAVVLPGTAGGRPWIATVSRAGSLELLLLDDSGPLWSTIHAARMGKGRLALGPPGKGGSTVLYSTHDDGRVLRHEGSPGGKWTTETIYLGPQGPRGIAAGRFHRDPAVETVAVFGYSKKVQILSREPSGSWKAETVFEDRDKGHWLAAAELDGRNATREIIGSGYGARIFMLARPPGYGMEGIPVDPDGDKKTDPVAPSSRTKRAPRERR